MYRNLAYHLDKLLGFFDGVGPNYTVDGIINGETLPVVITPELEEAIEEATQALEHGDSDDDEIEQ